MVDAPPIASDPQVLSTRTRLLTRLASVAFGLIGVVFFVAPGYSATNFPWNVSEFVAMTIGAVKRTVEVGALTDKRGPAAVAAGLYTETPESASAREQAALERRLARPPGADLGARPTKLDRRRLEALRRAQRHWRSR